MLGSALSLGSGRAEEELGAVRRDRCCTDGGPRRDSRRGVPAVTGRVWICHAGVDLADLAPPPSLPPEDQRREAGSRLTAPPAEGALADQLEVAARCSSGLTVSERGPES